MFIYQKTVDRSTLRQGFQIPVEFHPLLAAMPGGMPIHGETRDITIIIDGVEYKAQLKNQGFDRENTMGMLMLFKSGTMKIRQLPRN